LPQVPLNGDKQEEEHNHQEPGDHFQSHQKARGHPITESLPI